MDIDLGGSLTAPIDIAGSPTTVDAVEYRDRQVRWAELPIATAGTLVLLGKMPAGGSLVVELWTVVDGVPDTQVVADDVPITDDEFVEHELEVANPGVNTIYRLRATATGADGLPALFLGALRVGVADELPTTDCQNVRTGIANVALSTIGITSPLASLETAEGVDAVVCRLHFDKCVDQVLRDFPWPFATAYADLAYVDGSETEGVNHDWTYSYRLPANCVLVRRVIHRGVKRTFDPNPPAFRVGANDNTGRLLFSDYADEDSVDPNAPTLPVEYTKRATCPVEEADELFREAVGFLLASKLAPGLARNKITAADCIGAYQDAIARARTAAANEQEKQQPDDAGGDASWIRER